MKYRWRWTMAPLRSHYDGSCTSVARRSEAAAALTSMSFDEPSAQRKAEQSKPMPRGTCPFPAGPDSSSVHLPERIAEDPTPMADATISFRASARRPPGSLSMVDVDGFEPPAFSV